MRPESESAAGPALPVGRRASWMRVARAALIVNMAAIVVVGLCFRVVKLGSVPGLNADEYFCLVSFRSLVSGDASHGLFVPTGRVLDVFYAVIAYLFDLVLPRSAATIRVASVFSGFLMAAVAFPLLRRVRSPFVAGIVTVLAVVTPIHISYSRIGWEYSQIPLATLLIVACALDERIWLAAVAMVAGVLVHPAIAYLAPIVLFSISYKLFKTMKTKDVRGLARLFALPLLAVAIFVFILSTTMRGLANDVRGMFAAVPGNLFDTGKMVSFVELYSNLFGAGVARQNLTDSPVIVFDLFNAAFLAVNAFLYLAYFATFFARRRKDASAGRDLCVVIGLLVGIVGFYLTRGPSAITPPYERYALFVVMPSLIVLTVMAESLATNAWLRGFALTAVCATAWLMLLEFKQGYFDYFATTGGQNAHITYHTNQVDPKVAALQWVRARGAAPVIYMKEWRTYWPVQYVASPDPSVRVVSLTRNLWSGGLSSEEFSAFLASPGNDFIASLRGAHGYVIGFPDGGFDANLRTALVGIPVVRRDFPDAGGLAVVSVWYVES